MAGCCHAEDSLKVDDLRLVALFVSLEIWTTAMLRRHQAVRDLELSHIDGETVEPLMGAR